MEFFPKTDIIIVRIGDAAPSQHNHNNNNNNNNNNNKNKHTTYMSITQQQTLFWIC